MPYSAVTQPSPLPRLWGGTFSSTDAVNSTFVSPNSMSTEPSAWIVKPRVMRTGRSWSAARPRGRMKLMGRSLSLAGCRAADRFVDLGDGALDGGVVEVLDLRVEHAGLDGR